MNNLKSLHIGTTILSIWSILNILPGLGSVVYILLGYHAPAFMYLFTRLEISILDPRILATTNSVALLLNTLIVSFFVLVFFVIRYGLTKSQAWSFWILLFSIGLAQIASYTADSYLNNQNILANLFSTTVIIVGFGFSARGIFNTNSNEKSL